jgi:hypothetical protein
MVPSFFEVTKLHLGVTKPALLFPNPVAAFPNPVAAFTLFLGTLKHTKNNSQVNTPPQVGE